jgi:hypothetical protein
MRKWIDLVETFDGPDHFDGLLYHATAEHNADACLRHGVRPTSYWGIAAVAEYYASTVEDDGYDPVMLVADIADFDESLLEPDYEGIDEPITYSLGKSSSTVRDEWEESEQTWRDSLRIIGSVRYRGTIKPRLDDA